MAYRKKLLLVKVLVLFCIAFISGASLEASEPVELSVKTEHTQVAPGEPFWVALHIKIDSGFHFYWKNPGEGGMAPALEWNLPEGLELSGLEWPVPTKYEIAGLETYGYEKETVLLVRLTPSQKLSVGKELPVDLTLKWVVCNEETCLPGESKGNAKVSVAAITDEAHDSQFFNSAREKLPLKTKTIKSVKNQKKIENIVHAEGISQEDLAEVDFYPGEPNRPRPEFKVKKQEDGTLHFEIEESTLSTSLKGLLLVKGKAYDVEFSAPSNGEIAMADINKSAKVQLSPEDSVDSTWMAIGLVFLGGLILNLMPCVLPVVSLKVLSFVSLAGSGRLAILKQGLSFALGILVSFWTLAIMLLVMKSYGNTVGWGFQLQSPFFVAIFAIIMLLLGLSLFGVFEVGVKMSSWAGQKEADSRGQHKGWMGSFMSGVLATAVATPCTGPFLGSAIGYAFTRPSFETLAIFTSLGLGMASPYILLSAFPKLTRFIPKPGAWMETLKQLMGFMMLLAVLWLTWVFLGQTSDISVIMLLAAYLAVGFAAWIYGKGVGPAKSQLTKTFSYLLIFLMSVGALKMIDLATQSTSENTQIAMSEGWEPFSLERLEALRKEGTPVFVDFTAKWCLICQTNHLVLSQTEVEKTLAEKGVVKMKADWTKNDPVITNELKKFGRSGVPLYLMYGSDNEQAPKILPQVLTSDSIISAADEMIK